MDAKGSTCERSEHDVVMVGNVEARKAGSKRVTYNGSRQMDNCGHCGRRSGMTDTCGHGRRKIGNRGHRGWKVDKGLNEPLDTKKTNGTWV